jgi:hypothetical protein
MFSGTTSKQLEYRHTAARVQGHQARGSLEICERKLASTPRMGTRNKKMVYVVLLTFPSGGASMPIATTAENPNPLVVGLRIRLLMAHSSIGELPADALPRWAPLVYRVIRAAGVWNAA